MLPSERKPQNKKCWDIQPADRHGRLWQVGSEKGDKRERDSRVHNVIVSIEEKRVKSCCTRTARCPPQNDEKKVSSQKKEEKKGETNVDRNNEYFPNHIGKNKDFTPTASTLSVWSKSAIPILSS